MVALTEPIEDIFEKIEKEGPAYQITPTLFFVKPNIPSAPTLLERLGILPEEGAHCGMVIDMVKGRTVGAMPEAAAEWYHGALEIESK